MLPLELLRKWHTSGTMANSRPLWLGFLFIVKFFLVNSGCSRHMEATASLLHDLKSINGTTVAFGGNLVGGKITGQGTVSSGSLSFEKINFVEQLNFKSVSEGDFSAIRTVTSRWIRRRKRCAKRNSYALDIAKTEESVRKARAGARQRMPATPQHMPAQAFLCHPRRTDRVMAVGPTVNPVSPYKLQTIAVHFLASVFNFYWFPLNHTTTYTIYYLD